MKKRFQVERQIIQRLVTGPEKSCVGLGRSQQDVIQIERLIQAVELNSALAVDDI